MNVEIQDDEGEDGDGWISNGYAHVPDWVRFRGSIEDQSELQAVLEIVTSEEVSVVPPEEEMEVLRSRLKELESAVDE